MSASRLKVAPPPRAIRRPLEVHSAPVVWTTPALLRLAVYAVVGTALLFMIAVITGARNHRQAMQSIGKDAAPSIIAAQHIRSALADMDADAAQDLLPGGIPGDAVKFEARRQEAVSAIIGAAENITYGDAERLPIQSLAFGLGTYTAKVQVARDLFRVRDQRFLDAYRSAADIMDRQLLPAAVDLDKANRSVLDDTYARQRAISSASMLFLLLAALVLGGVLIAIQMFLATRMRRMVNPLLVLATFIAGFFTIYTISSFQAGNHDLKVAKEDAFDSIHALWQARALVYSANADESRFLLEPTRGDSYDENAFRDKADRIAHFPTGRDSSEPTSGYLADELRNVTFSGEREQATEAIARFRDYLALHEQVKRTVQDKSKVAFGRFDDALGKTLAINQTAFDQAVARGFNDVSGFEITAPIASFLIAAFAFLGLLPRIREYGS